jgi:hypothetical protein
MTDTPDFPALVELAQRLEGKDRKTCELALYTLKKQDERLAKKDELIAELEALVDARVKMYDDVLSASVKTVNQLREALLPFAAIADESTANLADNYMYPDCYPMSAFRAAKAALENK